MVCWYKPAGFWLSSSGQQSHLPAEDVSLSISMHNFNSSLLEMSEDQKQALGSSSMCNVEKCVMDSCILASFW